MKTNHKIDWFILALVITAQLAGLLILGRLISRQVETLVERKHQLIALEGKDRSLANLQENYNSFKEEIEIINRALPDKKGIVVFINQLEKEASTAGLLAKMNFRGQAVTSEAGVKSINFNLTLEGSYFQVLAFIKKMEKMSQVVLIDKISLQSPQGIEGETRTVLTARCYIDPNF